MNPITHTLASWTVANVSKNLEKRDMLLITAAGISPDIDGFGVAVEYLTRDTSYPLLWWTDYHHSLHTIFFCIIVCVATALFARKKLLTTALAAFAFHVHIFCDLIGARGSDGYQWPIPYLRPFSEAWQLAWEGQWQLNAWPNIAITIVLLLITFRLAWLRGYSPIGLVSGKADIAFVETIRKRFPKKK
jgi:inner membrane protein